MHWVHVWVCVTAACTTPNPRSCSDGACTDPAFPFCDVGGTLGGERNECIAVSCSAGEVVECRNQVAVTCDESEGNYTLQQCSRGCSVELGGCIVDPSNHLGEYVGAVAEPADLILTSATIDTSTGTINGNAVANFLKPAADGGVPIRVFVAKRVVLQNVTVHASDFALRPALAIVALEQIAVDGRLQLGAANLDPPGVLDGACTGKPNVVYQNGSNELVLGAGGGGNVTAGGHGGDVVDESTSTVGYAGGLGGGELPGESLVPLRGGCRGGGGGGGKGGGAVQLSSLTKVVVSGTIDARGQRGSEHGGGGAGGSVLLEAPMLEIGSSARFLLHGGGGATYTSTLGTDPDYLSPGGVCQSATLCTHGGDGGYVHSGGAIRSDAKHGAPLLLGAAPTNSFYTGSGGGSVGRLRLNTNSGSVELPTGAIVTGVTTVGGTNR